MRTQKARRVSFYVAASLLSCLRPTLSQTDDSESTQSVAPQWNVLKLCWASTAALYAIQTCEDADTVVESTFAKCALQENALRDAVLAKAPYKRTVIEGVMSGLREGTRPTIWTQILDDRAYSGRCANRNSN